jgi:hypothetical protein
MTELQCRTAKKGLSEYDCQAALGSGGKCTLFSFELTLKFLVAKDGVMKNLEIIATEFSKTPSPVKCYL